MTKWPTPPELTVKSVTRIILRSEDRDDVLLEDHGHVLLEDHGDVFLVDHDDVLLENHDDIFLEDHGDVNKLCALARIAPPQWPAKYKALITIVLMFTCWK